VKYKKKFLAMASILGFGATESAFADQGKVAIQPSNELKLGLTGVLIKHEIFISEPEQNTISIDEHKLLRLIKAELTEKLQARKLHHSDRELFENLLQNLDPGSFERNTNGGGFSSLDFNKAD
jgi:hypothetical protein